MIAGASVVVCSWQLTMKKKVTTIQTNTGNFFIFPPIYPKKRSVFPY
jgi:hypothetical protein